MIAKRALLTLMIPVFTFAMDNQDSPRKGRALSLSSPRVQSPRINRSGSNSDVAVAAVAHATLKRVITPDKLNVLKKSGNSGCFTPKNSLESSVEQLKEISEGSTEASPAITPREQKLVALRDSLRRSKSPVEDGEAELVFYAKTEEGLVAVPAPYHTLRTVVAVPVGEDTIVDVNGDAAAADFWDFSEDIFPL